MPASTARMLVRAASMRASTCRAASAWSTHAAAYALRRPTSWLAHLVRQPVILGSFFQYISFRGAVHLALG